MEIVTTLLIGLAGGVLAGLLGVGGGILFVPAMVLILGEEQHVAQGVSLVVIIPTALSATYTNARRGYVDWDIAKWVTVPAVVLAFGGAYLAGQLEASTLSRIFGVVVLYAGGRTLYTTWRTMQRERAAAREAANEPPAERL